MSAFAPLAAAPSADRARLAELAPVPPCPTLNAVVRPASAVMSPLAPDAAAERPARALAAEVTVTRPLPVAVASTRSALVSVTAPVRPATEATAPPALLAAQRRAVRALVVAHPPVARRIGGGDAGVVDRREDVSPGRQDQLRRVVGQRRGAGEAHEPLAIGAGAEAGDRGRARDHDAAGAGGRRDRLVAAAASVVSAEAKSIPPVAAEAVSTVAKLAPVPGHFHGEVVGAQRPDERAGRVARLEDQAGIPAPPPACSRTPACRRSPAWHRPQESSAASAFRARRFTASGVVLMASRLVTWIAVIARRKLDHALTVEDVEVGLVDDVGEPARPRRGAGPDPVLEPHHLPGESGPGAGGVRGRHEVAVALGGARGGRRQVLVEAGELHQRIEEPQRLVCA